MIYLTEILYVLQNIQGACCTSSGYNFILLSPLYYPLSADVPELALDTWPFISSRIIIKSNKGKTRF